MERCVVKSDLFNMSGWAFFTGNVISCRNRFFLNVALSCHYHASFAKNPACVYKTLFKAGKYKTHYKAGKTRRDDQDRLITKQRHKTASIIKKV